MQKFRLLIISISVGLMSITAIETRSQTPTSLASMAQEYSVSPDVISKFRDSGLSTDDMKKALEMSREVADKGMLNTDEAAEQILKLKQDGAEWTNIANDFDISVPASN